MKREGRQQGLVKTHLISSTPTPKKPINQLEPFPTAGMFQKVPSKPTNHSKFTGKCGQPRCFDCHDHPVSKKAKGTQKLKSLDVFMNHRLLEWRLVGLRHGFKPTGNLGHFSGDYWGEDDDEEEDLEEEFVNPVAFSGCLESVSGGMEGEEVVDFGFCGVGFVLDSGDEEDWCIVEEL